MYKHIHVIINPASGQDKPVLSMLNTAFQAHDIDWDVFVTKQAGDGGKLVRQALTEGVDAVAVYGGDGTIGEVASAMIGSEIPLAIFPGGTANAIALALSIPTDLAEACALATNDSGTVRTLDAGRIGERVFLVGIGLGLVGALAESADRESKDKLGPLAYVRGALQALSKSKAARYRLKLDGLEVESQGVVCGILNGGNFGIPGLSIAPSIKMDDGLLDVIVVRNTDIDNLVGVATSVVRQDESAAPYEHWQAREISVESDPPQAIQADGEVLKPGSVVVSVIPQALRVIVPRQAAQG